MHAGFPCFSQDIQQVMRLGVQNNFEMPELVDSITGPILAASMAALLKLGFGYIMRDCLLDQEQSDKAMAFFDENFIFRDPNAPDGQRFYQGRFLFRTRKPGDNMNVWLRFCPQPDDLFVDTPLVAASILSRWSKPKWSMKKRRAGWSAILTRSIW